jgi:DNA-binding transcriptional LysR family regulator
MYFIKLYETGNITRTADELFISRQALSESIRNLETTVGAQLFVRGKKGVIPTHAGKVVYRNASEMLLLWQRTLAEIGEGRGRLTLSLGTDMNYLPEPAIRGIYEYEGIGSGTKIELIQYQDQKQILQDVLKGRLDVGFLINAPEHETLVRVEVFTSTVYCLMGSGNKLASRREVDFFKDLEGQNILCGYDLYEGLAPFLNEARATAELFTDSPLVMKERLIHGRNVCLIPEHAVSSMASELIVARKCVSVPMGSKAYVICRSDNPKNAEAFAEFLIPIFSKM